MFVSTVTKQSRKFHTGFVETYRYGFNGQEKDDEISGAGNVNTAAYWQYDTRLGRRWNQDPKINPSISNYGAFANNPLFNKDRLGDVIDPSALTASQKKLYDETIEVLSESDIFKIYYEHLQTSKTVFKIAINADLDVGGKFNYAESKVTVKSFDPAIVAQELFHAFQTDLNVYDKQKDHSVIETEGDIMTQYVANEATIGMGGMLAEQADTWGINILGNGGKQFINPTNKEVQSEEYDKKFTEAVDMRIDHFKEKDERYKGYTTPNSGQKPLATKKIFEELDKKQKQKSK